MSVKGSGPLVPSDSPIHSRANSEAQTTASLQRFDILSRNLIRLELDVQACGYGWILEKSVNHEKLQANPNALKLYQKLTNLRSEITKMQITTGAAAQAQRGPTPTSRDNSPQQGPKI